MRENVINTLNYVKFEGLCENKDIDVINAKVLFGWGFSTCFYFQKQKLNQKGLAFLQLLLKKYFSIVQIWKQVASLLAADQDQGCVWLKAEVERVQFFCSCFKNTAFLWYKFESRLYPAFAAFSNLWKLHT
jgi:hypothetical protein